MENKRISILAALLLLPACATLQGNFPEQSKKAVELSRKGVAYYCDKVAYPDRLKLRETINTAERGAVVYCTPAEKEALFGNGK